MDSKELDKLLDKLASGAFSVEEEHQVLAFIHSYNRDGDSGLSEADFAKAKGQIWQAVQRKTLPEVKRLPLRTMIAAAVTAIALCIYFFNFRIANTETVVFNATSDHLPGKNAATLTLANGKKIYITDTSSGKLAEASGVIISKTPNGQLRYEVKAYNSDFAEINSLETSKGEQIEVILPDQSKVRLNAASYIRYPSNFSRQGERKLELSGEAFFEISKDRQHPFIVKTKSQEVKVLGTHFNISAYDNEHLVKTTLLEGAVMINRDVILKPGQLAIDSAGSVKIKVANLMLETAWTRNDFHFDEEPSESVMLKISRWYNISVSYSDKSLKTIPLSGYISRTRTLSTVLERIGKAANLRFVVTGQNVRVEKM